METILITDKEILDYETEIGVELIVKQAFYRHTRPLFEEPYYTCFDPNIVKVIDGAREIVLYGVGNTIEDSISNYGWKITDRRLSIKDSEGNKTYVRAPHLIYTPIPPTPPTP